MSIPACSPSSLAGRKGAFLARRVASKQALKPAGGVSAGRLPYGGFYCDLVFKKNHPIIEKFSGNSDSLLTLKQECFMRLNYLLFCTLSILLFNGCDLEEIPPQAPAISYNLQLLGSNNLTGETLPPIEVKVVDQENNPVPDVELEVSVSSGSVDDNQPTTDNQGMASINWTLGDTPGEQTMTIGANRSQPITITALVTRSLTTWTSFPESNNLMPRRVNHLRTLL